MKKFFKFGCLGAIGIVVLLVILVAALGGNDEEKEPVSNNAAPSKKSEEKGKDEKSNNEKVVSINKDFEVNGLKIQINDIKITKKDVFIDIATTNTTDNQLTFYPDQGSIIIGNTQVDANMFMSKGDVSGDIHPGVEKTGTVRFLAPDGKEFTPEDITEIKLALGSVFNDKTFDSADFNETIILE